MSEEIWLPTDEDTNSFFEGVAKILVNEISISSKEASLLVKDYYLKFTDENFCESINIPVQDDDFFFHEGAGGMVLRIHYYLVQSNDPDPHKFIEWRSNRRIA